MRKRRDFLKKLANIIGAGFFLFIGNLTFFPLLLKTKKENKSSVDPFYYGFKCISKKHPNKVYKTASEFWKDHPDEISRKLNNLFLKKGWIITTHSSLSKEGEEVFFEKYYKTRFYSEFYTKLWIELSNGKIKEFESVTYTLFKSDKKSIRYFV